jgi:hypothetical protein
LVLSNLFRWEVGGYYIGGLFVFRGYPDIIERIMKAFYYVSDRLGPEISLRMGDEGALCPHS